MTDSTPEVHVGAFVRPKDGGVRMTCAMISGDKAECTTAWNETRILNVADLVVEQTLAARAEAARTSKKASDEAEAKANAEYQAKVDADLAKMRAEDAARHAA